MNNWRMSFWLQIIGHKHIKRQWTALREGAGKRPHGIQISTPLQDPTKAFCSITQQAAYALAFCSSSQEDRPQPLIQQTLQVTVSSELANIVREGCMQQVHAPSAGLRVYAFWHGPDISLMEMQPCGS